MSSASTGPLSTSIGDYLKAIWTIVGGGSASAKEVSESGTASTNELSGQLSVSPASVTNMLGRLQEMGFVEYERYRGASLTEEGREEALRLVRRHRLIETFLIEYLGYPWEEVHEEAERLEHAVSDAFTERLAELLGHPERDPHGDPIPAADGTVTPEDSSPLSDAAAGERVRISRVDHKDAAVLAYLGERGLVPGRLLGVTEVRTLDGVVTVEDEKGTHHTLGAPLAASILVQTLS